MDNQKFHILLSGQLIDGFERADVEKALCRLLKLPLDQVQRLLMGKRSRIQKSFDFDKAEHLKEKLIDIGLHLSTALIPPLDLNRQRLIENMVKRRVQLGQNGLQIVILGGQTFSDQLGGVALIHPPPAYHFIEQNADRKNI